MKNIKSILCTAAIGLMLIVQLLHPTSVFADGEGTPPPTSTPVVTETPQPTETFVETAMPSGTPENTVTPDEAASPTDVPAVTPTLDPNEPTAEPVAATPIATEFANPGAGEPTVESVATTPAPTVVPNEEEDETKVAPTDTSTPTAEPVVSEEDSTLEEPSLGEVLSEISTETGVIVLDENGQPEPLATVEAAEAISSGDPVWCPAGQAPTPGLNGCTTSYASLGDLVASEGGNIAADGTIWIASGTTTDTGPVIIDGTVYTNWANYSLTLQGGWSGVSGQNAIGSNSVFSVPIVISNWTGSVAVNNITLDNVTTSSVLDPWNVSDGSALAVQTSGNININDVTVTRITVPGNTGGYAIKLENLEGAGDVIVTSTNSLDNNNALGLYVISNGNIALNDVTANNNTWGGGFLHNNFGGTGNITMTGNNIFNNNYYTGLTVTSNGNISLSNVNASGNLSFGLNIFETGTGLVSLNNITANNNSYGIVNYSFSNGTVIINHLFVSGNSVGVYDLCGDLIMNNAEISNNGVGLLAGGVKTITLNSTNFINNGVDREDFDYTCDDPTPTPSPTPIPIIVQPEVKFTFDCSKQAAYPVKLPNGDLVNIFCPVSGIASIYRLDNTGLPANLPEGYTYASAFTLDIKQQGKAIPVITEGGYVKSSFVAQPLQPGNTYTVLYWDPWIYENGELVENPAGGSWVPLKDFLLDWDGNTESFDLFPGTDDPRRVISGVNLVDRNGTESIEVSTNFPGIFVLAQR